MSGKRKCRHCEAYKLGSEMFIGPNGVMAFCDSDHAAAYAFENKHKGKAKMEKASRVKNKARKLEIRTRSEWYAKLQAVVNQWIVHVRDKGKSCVTCGNGSPSIKFDAGHWLTVAARPDLRFEPSNIHKQCSRICNQEGSGKQMEHRQFIEKTYGGGYGLEYAICLEGPHRRLKEAFPHVDDIKAEIDRYKVILRAHGLTPRNK